MEALLALEDGTSYRGIAAGADGETSGEVVFNTSMTGYQEILTDPSYAGQIVTMTCPQIGNYGVAPDDVESTSPKVAGFIMASRGTAAYLRAHGIPVEVLFKVNEGRPNVADHILNRHIDLIVNTPLGRESFFDDRVVRRVAMLHGVPCITTLTGAAAAVSAIRGLRQEGLGVRALQDYYAETAARSA